LIEMKKVNPAIIPRNHLVEEVLRAAEDQNDFAKLHRLLEALADPFSDAEKFIDFTQPPNPAQRVYQTFCGT
jgi:uncharacterized protein YdiU (UPF0061 family)